MTNVSISVNPMAVLESIRKDYNEMFDLRFKMEERTKEDYERWNEIIASIRRKEAMVKKCATSTYGTRKFNAEMVDIRRGMQALMS